MINHCNWLIPNVYRRLFKKVGLSVLYNKGTDLRGSAELFLDYKLSASIQITSLIKTVLKIKPKRSTKMPERRRYVVKKSAYRFGIPLGEHIRVEFEIHFRTSYFKTNGSALMYKQTTCK